MIEHIGRNLRRLRRERDLTQAQVARLIGIRQQHLSDIEKGKIPKLSLVERIAKRLCVSPDELLRDVEVPRVESPRANDASVSA